MMRGVGGTDQSSTLASASCATQNLRDNYKWGDCATNRPTDRHEGLAGILHTHRVFLRVPPAGQVTFYTQRRVPLAAD